MKTVWLHKKKKISKKKYVPDEIRTGDLLDSKEFSKKIKCIKINRRNFEI